MKATETTLKGCFILEPTVIPDGRGYFMESFNKQKFANLIGREVDFVQDNQSFSTRGVIRGLHYQCGEHAQAKLVRVLHGEVLDVAVDLRQNSPTYGKVETVLLSAENQKQFFVPRGFAHGFVVLSETAVFFYKCDNYYNKSSEGGVYFNDPELEINWQIPHNELIISEKDQNLPPLKDALPV
jgi:dTDP-4-dehydrorhamnose 3,5-epimerase